MLYHVMAINYLLFLHIFYFSNSLIISSFRVGPMNIEPRERKAAVRRKRVNLTENSQPEEVRKDLLLLENY